MDDSHISLLDLSFIYLKCTGHANSSVFYTVLGFPLILSLFFLETSGWCGEVRDVIYTDNGKVTVIYRVTVRGTDGEVSLKVLPLLITG